jgi:uroporphyrinogen decarboxylase
MHFQSVDHVPDEEFGYWDNTFKAWHGEGLPREVTSNDNCDPYFGFAPRSKVPVCVDLSPPFKDEVVEETDEYQIRRDSDGALKQVFKSGKDSIPHYIDYSLKGRKEWEEIFKPRLDTRLKSRYPENRPDWEGIKARFNDPAWEAPVGIDIGSLFGWLRNWMGFENIAVMMYDQPNLMHEIIEHLATLTCAVIERSVREIKIDYAAGWEDMCFNHGPIISPSMFREFLTPRYKKITDLLRSNGVDVIYMDCDGNINDIIDPWLEGGVNGIFPVEVRGGSDPIAIRQKYGKRVVILGGIDKHALLGGKSSIKRYLNKIKPYVQEGGWIPHVDHRVPPDVTFENYVYYLHLKRDMFRIPHPKEFESRPEVRAIKAGWRSV